MNLLKIQSMSFLSRFGTMLVGNVFQSLLVIALLSQEEYGMVAIVASLVSIIGASQSFGLTSGSTRELSSAKTKEDAKAIFLTSLILRFLMSFPFAVLLFLQADNLSLKSSNPDIIAFAIKITALVMFFEPLRGVFNSVISSYHQFKILFIYQFLISVVSLLIYAPMLYFFAFRGFYFAYFLFSLIATLVLLFIALRNFKGIKINFSTNDFIKYSRELFSISLGIYFVKILYSFWLSGPALYFNYFGGYGEKTIAVFALAILFATKLLIFSDSITDVTLAVNSKKYVEEPELFKLDYKENYIKTSFIIAFFCSVFAFFNFEIIAILNMLTKKDYSLSSYIIPFIVIGVWFYSNIDLLKSSVLVPAKKIVGMVFIHVFLIISLYTMFFTFSLFTSNSLLSFSVAFALSSVISYFLTLLFMYFSMNYFISNFKHLSYLFISVLFILSYYLVYKLILIKIIIFIVYLLFSGIFYKLFFNRKTVL